MKATRRAFMQSIAALSAAAATGAVKPIDDERTLVGPDNTARYQRKIVDIRSGRSIVVNDVYWFDDEKDVHVLRSKYVIDGKEIYGMSHYKADEVERLTRGEYNVLTVRDVLIDINDTHIARYFPGGMAV